MRLTRPSTDGWSIHNHPKESQIHQESLAAFQHLFEELTYLDDFRNFDTVRYISPFLTVIRSPDASGALTAVALAGVNKFVSFGLVSPSSLNVEKTINTLGWGVVDARFQADETENDEVVLLKILSVMIDTLRCPSGVFLNDGCVWEMVRKAHQIATQPMASHLLRSTAESTLMQMILTIFAAKDTKYGSPVKYSILKYLAYLMSYGYSNDEKLVKKDRNDFDFSGLDVPSSELLAEELAEGADEIASYVWLGIGTCVIPS